MRRRLAPAVASLLAIAIAPAVLGDGACIIESSTCEVTDATQCGLLGGVFVGEGTTCAASVGACCFGDGSCALTAVDGCIGSFAGPGTDCTDTGCPQPGACCLPGGGCAQTDLVGGGFDVGGTCVDIGGAYLGDDTACAAGGCAEPGWSWVDNLVTLTKNEPAWWSAATGMPKGLSPLTVLDPEGPGRPDPDGSGDRVLRGYVLAWAVDAESREIRWNHLAGTATVVDYRDTTAWEHGAWAFPAVAAVATGAPTGSAGVLELDGAEFVRPFDQLLLSFWAVGDRALTGGASAHVDTDLTLLPVGVDLRQETEGPVTTKATFAVWNGNEIKFSGTDRCVTCWSEAPLSGFGVPNHFLREHLQTDGGHARIDGVASSACDIDADPGDGLPLGSDPRDVVSTDAALLGVAARMIRFGGATSTTAAGTTLHGAGVQSAVIRHDVLGPPPEALGEASPVVPPALALSATPPVSSRTKQETVPGVSGADRVSSTEKGSLLLFPKVELRWDADGQLVADTFIALSNDYPQDVRVQMYFVNGDPPR